MIQLSPSGPTVSMSSLSVQEHPSPTGLALFHKRQRKRKRLNAVLDKLSNHITPSSPRSNVNRSSGTTYAEKKQNERREKDDVSPVAPLSQKSDGDRQELNRVRSSMLGRDKGADAPKAMPAMGDEAEKRGTVQQAPDSRRVVDAALRRELWRENPQFEVHESEPAGSSRQLAPLLAASQQFQQRAAGGGVAPGAKLGSEVFRFDSFDRERFQCAAISEAPEVELEVFSPVSRSSRSPHSSLSSPQVSVDSPKICFSPLRIKDSIDSIDEEEEDNYQQGQSYQLHFHSNFQAQKGRNLPRLSVRGCNSPEPSSAAASMVSSATPSTEGSSRHSLCPSSLHSQNPHSPNSPNPPLTPVSPGGGTTSSSFHQFERYFQSKYLPDIYRRRCHSDTDLHTSFEGSLAPMQKPNLYTQHSDDASHRVTGVVTSANTVSSTVGAKGSHFSGRYRFPPAFNIPSSGGSVESDQSDLQDSPLDLSVRGGSISSDPTTTDSSSRERINLSASTSNDSISAPKLLLPPASGHHVPSTGIQVMMPTSPLLLSRSPGAIIGGPPKHGGVGGTGVSGSFKESIYSRYHLEVSPVVEAMPPGSDVAYVCPVCGQMFSLHDRLAKHMASRHKTPAASRSSSQESATAGAGGGGVGTTTGGGSALPSSKSYGCDVCKRTFARSDMLTRHMRLHTGVKPYTCRVCGQVFSRSDHLSTHQRTHTGEKPYRCPSCPYAACRRDMITRHMRTHMRYELQESASLDETDCSSSSSSTSQARAKQSQGRSNSDDYECTAGRSPRAPVPLRSASSESSECTSSSTPVVQVTGSLMIKPTAEESPMDTSMQGGP